MIFLPQRKYLVVPLQAPLSHIGNPVSRHLRQSRALVEAARRQEREDTLWRGDADDDPVRAMRARLWPTAGLEVNRRIRPVRFAVVREDRLPTARAQMTRDLFEAWGPAVSRGTGHVVRQEQGDRRRDGPGPVPATARLALR